jgi:hypothetical protein
MTTFRVRTRLARAVRDFISQYGLEVSVSGRIYLSFLLTKAAVTIVRDGRVGDLETAEESFRSLLMEASGGVSPVDAGPGLALS